MLIDSHCHLDRLELGAYPGGLPDALAAAQARGVEKFLCVGISVQHREQVLAIAERYDAVVASVGVHPLDVESGLASESQLVDWARHPKIVAIGETGLDYYYSADSKPLQRRSFATHLEAAAAAALPVIVHTRDARNDTLELIRAHGDLEHAGVLHCFTEDWQMASKAMDMNYLISISGIVTFRNASALRDVVKRVPLDRLLVETDSPYLAPVPYRGKPNEPQYVREVAEFVAELKGVSFETLAARTAANFFRLFPRARG
ncbi:TatD family deoxyribonuclease [Exilibacterium tricleocarpae]|uniref:TatD family deoxyribonuclease n=1 Tax=Exilibacterium tricleocarpae TaxID=2591008 RepID=A0A545T8F3_9GAMM|nr:TatD family hydrolase [Exilibacterium tricleocarpae]TQV73494.1 TatD family deoxyribonuclease [Exilibacterium tricleocarpae]